VVVVVASIDDAVAAGKLCAKMVAASKKRILWIFYLGTPRQLIGLILLF